MLADHAVAEVRAGARTVLELCAGTGAIAVAAARAGADVTAVDVSRRALVSTRMNAALHGVRVRTARGDLLAPVAGMTFDLIASNPPYLPGESDALPRRGIARAWEGGRSGRLLLDRIIDEAPAHVAPGGSLMLVHSSLNDTDETLARLAARGLEPEVLARKQGPLGRVMSGRAGELERRGLLRPGERTEEIVVIAGRNPA